jgi:hypothetical protein
MRHRRRTEVMCLKYLKLFPLHHFYLIHLPRTRRRRHPLSH